MLALAPGLPIIDPTPDKVISMETGGHCISKCGPWTIGFRITTGALKIQIPGLHL